MSLEKIYSCMIMSQSLQDISKIMQKLYDNELNVAPSSAQNVSWPDTQVWINLNVPTHSHVHLSLYSSQTPCILYLSSPKILWDRAMVQKGAYIMSVLQIVKKGTQIIMKSSQDESIIINNRIPSPSCYAIADKIVISSHICKTLMITHLLTCGGSSIEH